MGEVLNRVEVVVYDGDHPAVEFDDGSDIAIRPEGTSDATIWLPVGQAERWVEELRAGIAKAVATARVPA